MANEPIDQQPKGAAAETLEPQPVKAAEAPQTVADAGLTAAEWKERARAEFEVSPHALHGALSHFDADEKLARSKVQDALDKFHLRRGA